MTTDEQLARGWFKEGVETFLKDKHAATFNTPDYYYASGYLRAKQEARIAALTKDAERLKFFNQVWRWKALKDGEIIYQYGEHVPSLFQKTAELLPTHQPAPKAITAEDVTDEVVDAVEDAIGTARGAWDMVDHKELIAAACKTIGQAPIALALLTVDEVRAAYINANNDGFDFEGQLQKAFCKKNGLPHPTE